MSEIAQAHILSLKPYVAGRSIGNNITQWAKLGSNENCFGPSLMALDAVKKSLAKSHLYPTSMRAELINKICQHNHEYKITPNEVELGNGSSELIINLVRGLVGLDESVVYGWPSFSMYQVAALSHDRKSVAVPLDANWAYDLEKMLEASRNPQAKILFLGNPNNPTGKYLDKNQIKEFASMLPKDVVLVVDEAYFEYVMDDGFKSALEIIHERPRTVVLRTFSKAYGLAGLRLGYAMGDAKIIDVLSRIRDPFNINSMVQHAAIEALLDQEHVQKSVLHNLEYLPKLGQGLTELGFKVDGQAGNFLMATRASYMPDIPTLCDKLFARGVIIRPLDAYDMSETFRVSVGTKEEIGQLFESLKAILW